MKVAPLLESRHRKDFIRTNWRVSHAKSGGRSSSSIARRSAIPEQVDSKIEALVSDIIGQVADRWTMLILEALHDHGTMRFTRLGEAVRRISQ